MRSGPRVDSKKFDFAVGDNDCAQRPSGAQPLRKIKIRNSAAGKTGLPHAQLIWPDRPAGGKVVRD